MAAGTEIERLFVKIEGDISGLNASMAKAGDAVDRAQKGMESSLGKMGHAFRLAGTALAGAFGVTSVASAVAGISRLQQGAIDYASAVKDAAIQTGFGTTALQELQFAAIQLGLSEESLGNGLRRLNLQIGEARAQGMDAVPVFKRLGLELNDASGKALSTDAVFRNLVDRLQRIKDPAIRAAEAFQVFGKEAGPKFLELIAGGTEGLDKYAEAARNAGVVLDEQYIDALKRTSDELAALDKQIEVNTAKAFGTTQPMMTLWKETLAAITGHLAANAEASRNAEQAMLLFGPAVASNINKLMGAEQAARDYLTVLEDIRTMGAGLPTPFSDGPQPFGGAIPLRDGPAATSTEETDEQRKRREASEQYVRDWHERVQAQNDAEDEIAEHNEQALEDERKRSEEYTELWWQRVDEQMEAEEVLAQFEDQKNAERYSAAKDALGNLSTLMASENRKMFEVGKAAAIAETIINTYESAQKAFTAMADIPYVGPALGAAAAAAAIAGGMARVQAIKNTSFGSKSVNVGVGNGISVGSGAAGAGGGSAGGSTGNVYISLKGQELFSGDAVRQLIERISEAQGDGARISVVS